MKEFEIEKLMENLIFTEPALFYWIRAITRA